jgi:hypothetical protein
METLGELADVFPDLGTWRLFAVAEKSANGGLLFGRLAISRFWRVLPFLADVPVDVEPVSGAVSPANREINREFRHFCPTPMIFGSK